jgi:hypothetical protein
VPAELLQWATPSLGGLCALFVVLVFAGKLVPRSTLQRERELLERRCDDYKAASEAAAARADKLADQQQQLIEHAKTTLAVLQALQRAAEQRRTR